MDNRLLVKSLSVKLGNKLIIDDLSIDFPSKGITCLLGANGAGKTTLLRAISGFTPAINGRIKFNDQNILNLTPRQRAIIVALVPQVAKEDLPIAVEDAIRLARYPMSSRLFSKDLDDQEEIDYAISALNLEDYRNRTCASLSGGEWRKVLIAQGLAQRTPVLLMDEPTAFLDPPARRQMLDCVKRIATARNISVIAVLHDLELVREFADHVVLLRQGSLLSCGSVEEVITDDNLAELYDCEIRWIGG